MRGLCDLCKEISIDNLSVPGGFKHADTPMFNTRTEVCDLCQALAQEEGLWTKNEFRLFLKQPKNSIDGTIYRSLGVSYEGGNKIAALAFPLFADKG